MMLEMESDYFLGDVLSYRTSSPIMCEELCAWYLVCVDGREFGGGEVRSGLMEMSNSYHSSGLGSNKDALDAPEVQPIKRVPHFVRPETRGGSGSGQARGPWISSDKRVPFPQGLATDTICGTSNHWSILASKRQAKTMCSKASLLMRGTPASGSCPEPRREKSEGILDCPSPRF